MTMSKFSKYLLLPSFAWLVAAMLVELIVTKTNIERGHGPRSNEFKEQLTLPGCKTAEMKFSFKIFICACA